MDLKLRDKTCLVTGASRGIGRGIAKVLAAEGCRVAVVARRGALLEELASEIVAAGGTRPLIVAADLTADGAMERIRYRVLEAFGGGLDVLVNNAGSSRPVPWNATEDQWHEGMQLNFELVRRLTNQFIPTMRAQRFGRIINITGANEPPGVNIASVAKAALHNWAKGLSRELAQDGITINCLPPGRINSEQILERLHPTPKRTAARSSTRTFPSATSASPRTWRTSSRFSPRRWRATSRARSSTSTAACIVSRADGLDRLFAARRRRSSLHEAPGTPERRNEGLGPSRR